MSRGLYFTPSAWKDYLYWTTQDKKTLKRLNKLIQSSLRTPFEGIGKPESLMGELTGYWSRRIDDKHRLVYRVTDTTIDVIQCRDHYGDK
ncbi:MAG: Txe/YoeB family addiction module toxin [Nitrosospira sp.]|nr:Txe/YoeB family addiction module toxin [Nitrosospira sp.]